MPLSIEPLEILLEDMVFLSENLPAHYHNLLLCGFMGAGKTWLLKRLQKTGPEEFHYTDLDQVILERSGYNTILKMMKALGEDHFRRIENELLLQLVKQGDHVIALGGGALNEGLNHVLCKRKDTLIVWIDTPLEQCLSNLRKDHKNVRPLAKQGESSTRELYQKRQEIYSVAQVRINPGQSPAIHNYPQLIAEIVKQLL